MDQQQREQQQRDQQQRELQQRELQQRQQQQQQRAGSIAGFYKAQVETAQDLTSASMEGFERIQQLAVQAMRQQIDNQFRMANTVAARSAEAIVDPEIARPALDRMIDVQRQMADTFVRTNQRVLSAVGSSAQRTVEQGTALSGSGNQQPTDVEGYSSMVQTAFQQWQELTNRMLEVFSQQFSTATGEIQRQGQRALDQTSEAVQA
ncbi:MAG: phasin family protein, partial [Burkholderiaceae bacterium]